MVVGGIMDMYSDLDGNNKDNKRVQSFAVNDVQKGIATDDIACNVEYKMAICSSTNVQLLSYQHVAVLPKECYREIYPYVNHPMSF